LRCKYQVLSIEAVAAWIDALFEESGRMPV
jgi:hypothetical protein